MKVSSIYDSIKNTPHVKKVRLRTDTQYLTEAQENEPHEIKYVVAGTAYGFLRKTSGDIRVWKSESGARKALRGYKSIHEIKDKRESKNFDTGMFDKNRRMANYLIQ